MLFVTHNCSNLHRKYDWSTIVLVLCNKKSFSNFWPLQKNKQIDCIEFQQISRPKFIFSVPAKEGSNIIQRIAASRQKRFELVFYLFLQSEWRTNLDNNALNLPTVRLILVTVWMLIVSLPLLQTWIYSRRPPPRAQCHQLCECWFSCIPYSVLKRFAFARCTVVHLCTVFKYLIFHDVYMKYFILT